MPNLPAHIDLANQAAAQLNHPSLDKHLGGYLLGSTAPDVRALNGGSREQYHFSTLEFRSIGDGVDGLFKAHPELKSQKNINGPTKAFLAGYITHLVLDESWIIECFRPYFGNPDVYRDKLTGLVMDRALQLEMDRLSMDDTSLISLKLAQSNDHIKIPFLPTKTLGAWQAFVLETVARDFSWDRLRFMARRIAKGDKTHRAHRVADGFLKAMPACFNTMFEHVSRDELRDFRSRSVERLTHVVGDYLG